MLLSISPLVNYYQDYEYFNSMTVNEKIVYAVALLILFTIILKSLTYYIKREEKDNAQ